MCAGLAFVACISSLQLNFEGLTQNFVSMLRSTCSIGKYVEVYRDVERQAGKMR